MDKSDILSVVMSGAVIVYMIIVTIVMIAAGIQMVSRAKVFEKCGYFGWKSVIPLYSDYIEYKIAFGNGWFFLLTFVPIANLVILIMKCLKLSNAFDGSGAIFVLLWLVPPVGYFLLAYNKDAEYGGDAEGDDDV